MTEFKQELRHFCRNPKCRSKLPAPVANEREAFCARGCYNSFYLHRCRVCEKKLEDKYRKLKPKDGDDKIRYIKVSNRGPVCESSECKRRWRAKDGMGRFSVPKADQATQVAKKADLRKETAAAEGLFCAIKKPIGTKSWRIIAGPDLTPSQFHCATVPDGPDCRWDGGSYHRIEAKNRAALDEHFDKLDAEAAANDFCAVCGRFDDLVDRRMMAADGYPPRGPDRWETICQDCLAKRSADRRAWPPMPTPAQYAIPDDLSIPQFLRRPLPRPERDSDSDRRVDFDAGAEPVRSADRLAA
jgi:hypothetical protein